MLTFNSLYCCGERQVYILTFYSELHIVENGLDMCLKFKFFLEIKMERYLWEDTFVRDLYP
jgi:hypothetical protein